MKKTCLLLLVCILFSSVNVAYAGKIANYFESNWNVNLTAQDETIIKIWAEQLADPLKASPTYRFTEDNPAIVLERMRQAFRDLDMDKLIDIFNQDAIAQKASSLSQWTAWEEASELQQVLGMMFSAFDKGKIEENVGNKIIDSIMPILVTSSFFSGANFPSLAYTIHQIDSNGRHAEIVASIYFFDGEGFQADQVFSPVLISTERINSEWKVTDIVEAGATQIRPSSELEGTWKLEYLIYSVPALADIKLTQKDFDSLGIDFDVTIKLESNSQCICLATDKNETISEESTWEYVNGYVDIHLGMQMIPLGDELKIVTGRGTLYFRKYDPAEGYSAFAKKADPNQFVYIENKKTGEAAITGYTGESVACLEIPSMIGNYRVTRIAAHAFQGSSFESVMLPEGIVLIGASAFENCSSLSSVQLPKSLSQIGASAFAGCSKLQHITLPFAVSQIPANTFSGCTNLKTVMFLSGETQIDEKAFDVWNINCIYGLLGSTAYNYAVENWIKFTPFISGTTWESEYFMYKVFFADNGALEGTNYSYRMYSDGVEFRDSEGWPIGRPKIAGNKMSSFSLSGGIYTCIDVVEPELELPLFGVFDEHQSIVGSRWMSRSNLEVIQFVDDHTLEFLTGHDVLFFSSDYYINDDHIFANCYPDNQFDLFGSTLLLCSDGVIIEMYDYIGDAIDAIVVTPTPLPTATPVPTPVPTAVVFTKDYLIGSWNNGDLVFFENGEAKFWGRTGTFRLYDDYVEFYEYDEWTGGSYESFYYKPNGTLESESIWGNFVKDK